MEQFRAINEAVCFWLGYQFKIGREGLMHEASLRYPIADTITAKETQISQVQLEKGHPYFNDKVVDIFVYNKDVKQINKDNSVAEIREIFELKLAKPATGTEFGDENQRVVDDILRLAYFHLACKKDAFFLMCGTYQNFKNYFIGQKDKPIRKNEQISVPEKNVGKTDKAEDEWNDEKSLYKNYFDFGIGKTREHTFVKNDIPENTSEKEQKILEFGLNSFQKRYSIKGNSFTFSPNLKVKTTCITITPFESKTSRTHACGIWRVESLS